MHLHAGGLHLRHLSDFTLQVNPHLQSCYRPAVHLLWFMCEAELVYAEARKKDIPIVQLNPGGTLNHKYAGETAVRSSGLPYSVIRSTGVHFSSSAPLLFQQRFPGRRRATHNSSKHV